MRWVIRVLIVGVAIYLVALLTLVIFQRRLMYFPSPSKGPPAAFGLPDAATLSLKTDDGERIVAWYVAAKTDRSIFLYMHGNGGTLADRASVFRGLTRDGSGLLAIDYRGYGGSTGSPSEAGLIRDGEAAYRTVRDLGYAPDQIVLIGESIGTGVAIAIAATNPVGAVVLDSAFSSAVDVAAALYRVFPVRMFMMDPFDSSSRVRAVAAPKLFLHGTDDAIIPIEFDRTLFDQAVQPKTFIELEGQGHVVLFDPLVPGRIKTWLASLPKP